MVDGPTGDKSQQSQINVGSQRPIVRSESDGTPSMPQIPQQLTERDTVRHIRDGILRLRSLASLRDVAPQHAFEFQEAAHAFLEQARRDNNNPAVANVLIDSMFNTPDRFAREVLWASLDGSELTRTQQAVTLQRHLNKLGRNKCQSQDLPKIVAELAALTADSVFADSMIDHVMNGKPGSFHVAHALRETPFPNTQKFFRTTVASCAYRFSEGGDEDTRQRIWALPYALDPKHPETASTLLAVITGGQRSANGNFEVAAIQSLGATEDRRSLKDALQSFYTPPRWNPNMQWALAGALARNMDPSIQAELRGFIDGPVIKSASLICAKDGHSPWTRPFRTINLIVDPAVVYERRLFAALALRSVEPELATKVFIELRDNEEIPFLYHNAADAALQEMEQARSSASATPS